jgi:hypothetical protein
LDFEKTLFTFCKKHLNIFFKRIKNTFGNHEKVKNCRKVAGKLQENCRNPLLLSIITYVSFI